MEKGRETNSIFYSGRAEDVKTHPLLEPIRNELTRRTCQDVARSLLSEGLVGVNDDNFLTPQPPLTDDDLGYLFSNLGMAVAVSLSRARVYGGSFRNRQLVNGEQLISSLTSVQRDPTIKIVDSRLIIEYPDDHAFIKKLDHKLGLDEKSVLEPDSMLVDATAIKINIREENRFERALRKVFRQ